MSSLRYILEFVFIVAASYATYRWQGSYWAAITMFFVLSVMTPRRSLTDWIK
jgi:uncharacterized membrane protein YccC